MPSVSPRYGYTYFGFASVTAAFVLFPVTLLSNVTFTPLFLGISSGITFSPGFTFAAAQYAYNVTVVGADASLPCAARETSFNVGYFAEVTKLPAPLGLVFHPINT